MNLLLELNLRQRTTTRVMTFVFGFVAFTLLKDNSIHCAVLGAVIALMLRNPATAFAFTVTLKRDLIAVYRFLALNLFITYMEYRRWSIARIFQRTALQYANKPMLQMDQTTLTFADVERFTNQIACYFKAQGFQHGDCIALLMETKPEYPCMWLGLSKIGVVTALINSNLKRETLLHSIKVANSKAIIVGTELTDVLAEVLNDAELQQLPIYQFSDLEQQSKGQLVMLKEATDLAAVLKEQTVEDLSSDIAACKPRDKLTYVYTSGTTGLPKAAVITNLRYLFMASGTHFMLSIHANDTIYDPLPLYHTAGGIVGVGNAIIHGSTIVLRKKFSASNFWKDCIKYNCTVAQYIGELCRYLLSTPPKPEDTQHNLRLMYGNGLRPQIWSQFVSRFNIPRIGEVYGSTEGNSNLANVSNQVGAIGFVPLLGKKIYPVQIIRCDEETGEPLRNSDGYCVRCEPGETGLMIGKVDPRRAVTAFNGYADKEASEKKLLKNVFKRGDVYFNSGDMLVGDLLGYFYFKDRTGDTFRWRGENVATQEVEAIITNVIGLQDCVVYGVQIPHVEGRAGMAAIVDPEQRVDMQHFSVGIRGSLPPYARPLFVRLMNEIPSTATFKLKKRDLVLEGYDIHVVRDPIYYLNKDGIYRPLTHTQFNDLQAGTAGL